MKSTAKKLAVCAAALCLLACGTAVSAAAASPVSGLALSGVAMPWDQDVPAESIEAGSYTANMLLGSSQQLSPVVRPRNSTDSVVFISDDTSILTVSNSGVVQAVGVGTTRITAAAGNQICAYTIVVSMDSSMIVTEMDLSLSSNTIYVGNSVSAQLQVRPTSASNYATVALTSSNEKVATVNNFGRVTGIAPGTATITAQSGDGLAASCIVRCRWEDPSQPPVRVDLSAFADRILSQYAFSAQGPAEDDSIDQHLPGLTSVSAQQCLVYLCQEPKNSEELILIEVTNAGDLEAVKSILQARINTMVSGGAWFPDAVEAWTHNSRVVSNGNFVMLVVHPQCDAIVEVFHTLF